MNPEHISVILVRNMEHSSTQCQPGVNQQNTTNQTVNPDPVPDPEIHDQDFQEPTTQPPQPTTSVTPATPSPR